MQTKVEGLLIHKTILKERDLMTRILLRNGKCVSIMFYGGLGGGKKIKSGILELGNMMKVELRIGRNKQSSIYTAKEWSTIWGNEYIRKNHIAFYLMCFFLELTSKISTEDNLYDEHRKYDKSLEGIFKVISNALFYMEKALKNDLFNNKVHLMLFLGKIIMEMGIGPSIDRCLFCKNDLLEAENVTFVFEHGGFACNTCNAVESEMSNGKQALSILSNISKIKYADFENVKEPINSLTRLLFDYLTYQFTLDVNSFRTLSFIM